MFSNRNSNNQVIVLVKRDKMWRKKYRELLRDSFVSYSLSTSRLPHTYLPTLGLYKYFEKKSVEGTLDIPQPLAVQVLSYLYCIAANETSVVAAFNIIGILLDTFRLAYENYLDPSAPEDTENPRVISVDFLMFILTLRLEIGSVFEKNYPGSFNRLEYFIKNLSQEYAVNRFAAPYRFMDEYDAGDTDAYETSLKLLQKYKAANSPDYKPLKKFMMKTFGYAETKPKLCKTIQYIVEENSDLDSVPTLKRTTSADSFFSQPSRVKKWISSRTSSLDLQQPDSSPYEAQRNTGKRL
ncbi:MAG: hypothetical protein V4501_00890 [Pseudomonadota bacterium]